MPEYTELQIAILTMPKEDLNTAAVTIADWTGRLLHGWFEDNETGEDRHYDMPEDLRPHLEVLGGLRERVSDLLDAIDNFGGYFPTDGEVKDGDFLVGFYESEVFSNAPTLSTLVLADSMDAIADSAKVINEWAVRILRVRDDLPEGVVASLQSLLGLNFLVKGLVDALDDALSGERELFDVGSR